MATKRWLGAAQDIQGVSTWTFADTFATNDTVDVECNNKHLILTLGTDVALSDVAAETAAMINAASATAGLVGATADETRNFGGQQIPEFTEVVASASGAVLTIKSTAGVPVEISISVTTAGDGTVGSETVVTAATGKHFLDNADNWEGGLFGAGDTLLFDHGSVDVKYALNNSTLNLRLLRKNGYRGNIGLAATNSLGYVEYRDRYLALPRDNTQVHVIGEQFSNVTTAGFTYIDIGSGTGGTLSLSVFDTEMPENGYAVHVVGGAGMNATVRKGSVAIGADLTATATLLASLAIGYLTDRENDAVVFIGANASFDTSADILQQGGTLYLENGDSNVSIDITNGTCYQNADSELEDVRIYEGGTLVARAGTIDSSLTVFPGGTFKSERTAAYVSFACSIHKGASFYDYGGVIGNAVIDFVGTHPGDPDTTFITVANRTWTSSAI